MTAKTSRRALIACVPALAAAAAFPTASTAAPARTSLSAMQPTADAELLALGEQLRPLFADWMKLKPKALRLYPEIGPLGKPWSLEQVEARYNKFEEESARTGYSLASQRCSAVYETIYELADRMLARRATTRDGLLMQAMAALAMDDTFDFHILERDREPVKIVLWELARDTGFAVPAWVKRRANRRAKLVAA
jgi:hypothetical protein